MTKEEYVNKIVQQINSVSVAKLVEALAATYVQLEELTKKVEQPTNDTQNK